MKINKNYRESRRRNKKYWEERARARSDVFVEDSEKIADELGKAYYSSSKIVEKEIAKVFQGFENAFGLSHSEAKRLIENAGPDVPSKELIGIINGLTDNDLKQQLLGYISAPAYQYRIKRLDEAVARAEKVCKSLYSSELHTDTEFFSSEIEKAYNHTIFDIQQGTGITGAFNQIPKSRIEEIMKNRWSGRHYSSRIWGNTSRLAQTLKNNLLESFITGESEQKAAARVRERFGVAAHNARCLVRTENTYITNQAEISGYKEAQVDEYEYMAVMDDDTSPICRRLNGRSFPVSKARAGFNLPPMHPFCRSTTIGKIPSEEELDAVWDKDMADMVPEDMEFEDWLDNLEPTDDGKLVFRDKRVDKSGESGIINENSTDFDMPNYDVEITDESIESISYIDVEGFSEEANRRFVQAQKDILSEAKKHPVGTEVSVIYNADTMEIIGDMIVGEDGTGSVSIPDSTEKYFAFHNHPDRATFSPADVDKLLCRGNMKGLVATGNDGSTYLFQPLDNVDVIGYNEYIVNALKEICVCGYSYSDIKNGRIDFSKIDKVKFYNDYTKAIESIWKGSEKYGFRYIKEIPND